MMLHFCKAEQRFYNNPYFIYTFEIQLIENQGFDKLKSFSLFKLIQKHNDCCQFHFEQLMTTSPFIFNVLLQGIQSSTLFTISSLHSNTHFFVPILTMIDFAITLVTLAHTSSSTSSKSLNYCKDIFECLVYNIKALLATSIKVERYISIVIIKIH